MSREEAIEYIKSADIHEEAEREAFEMAIKALEDIPKYRKEARRWKRKVLLADDKKALQKAYENGFTMGQLVSEQEPTGYANVITAEDVKKYYTPCDDAISRDFQIGDEVRIIGSDPIYDDCDVGWVIRNASEKVKTMYVMRNDGSADEEAKAEWYKTGRHNATLAEVIKALPSVTQKSGKCKNCKYFEYDSVAKVDGVPLIVAHEICNKWGDGCKTSEDGYCYLYEPKKGANE